MKTILHTLKAASLSTLLCTTSLVTALSLASCDKDSSVKEKVDDVLDRRPAEGIKDAGEDIKDSVKEAGKETKEAVKEAVN